MIVVTEGALDLLQLVQAVEEESGGSAGAVATFLGVVRNNSQGRNIKYLEYQAYAPMAESELAKIAGDSALQFDVHCAIAHRFGRLEVGEISLAVAVASPHRGAAFEACRSIVDRIKQTVPIWKKEVAEDGYWWVEDPLASQLSSDSLPARAASNADQAVHSPQS